MRNNELNNVPLPFCFNRSKVKAFVLGADPTNFSKDRKRVDLHYVFGIGQNPNYFRVILQNLKEIGLHLEDVYIQNLLPEYQEKETGINEAFMLKASENAKTIAREFNKIDPTKRIPVFLTAEDVYRAIYRGNVSAPSCKSFYNLETLVPINANDNMLGRPAIPLFRNGYYELSEWPQYKLQLKKIINDLNI